MLSTIGKVLKKFHPEGIPWPGTALYNAVSKTNIFQRHYELISRDLLTYCSEGRVLDIGTGPGWLLKKLREASPKFQITGLDISASMVAKARKNIKQAGLSDVINIEQGQADSMPFADCSFDMAVSTGSIHHWKDPTSGLNEIYRILKRGGHALIYDLVSDTPKSIMKTASQEFGRLKIFLLWLHAFDEPFYSYKKLHLLACPSLFKEGQTQFVGVMCCLIVRK
ncbi:MAG: class I SAM-dependent methyltransferase [Planctomycetota bacterium]|jgi:ubiquinone/menaquinone biosynthesis C-methylase UbiE